MLKRGLAIAVLLMACGKKDESKPTPPPETKETKPAEATADAAAVGSAAAGSAAAPSGPCAERGANLTKRLSELATATPGFMPLQRAINAPESAAGKSFETRGYVVAVAKDGKLYIEGQEIAAKELKDWLDAAWKMAREQVGLDGGSTKDAKFQVYVWADRDAAAGRVGEVVETAKAVSDQFVTALLVAGKPASPPADTKLSPEVQAIAAKLPKTEPKATKYLVDQLKAAIGTCEAIIMPWAATSHLDPPPYVATKLAKEVPQGLVKCDCKIPNVDVFEWGITESFGASAPALAWVEMPAIKKGDKQPISKLVK
jgi:biopolymer transport protein ExbD